MFDDGDGVRGVGGMLVEWCGDEVERGKSGQKRNWMAGV